MNTEPVAWMEYIQGVEWEIWFVEPTNLPDGHTYKPLYTHPAKTLTDSEILALWTQKNNLNGAKDVVDFARAILKKVSEK